MRYKLKHLLKRNKKVNLKLQRYYEKLLPDIPIDLIPQSPKGKSPFKDFYTPDHVPNKFI